jgi:hypothetical protein
MEIFSIINSPDMPGTPKCITLGSVQCIIQGMNCKTVSDNQKCLICLNSAQISAAEYMDIMHYVHFTCTCTTTTTLK